MTEGYASDIDGDDTVMDEPEAIVSINLSNLPAQQAMLIAQQAGLDQQKDHVVGSLVKGEVEESYIQDAEFHLPLGPTLTMLDEMDVIDLPEQPPDQAAPPQEGEEVVTDDAAAVEAGDAVQTEVTE